MAILADDAPMLVIAPHPDDEVLGCGGTIARCAAAGTTVHVAIVTTGRSPRFDEESVTRVRAEAEKAHTLLGVAEAHFLDLPAAELDGVTHAELNEAIGGLVNRVRPKTLFLPFVGDIHLDHQLVFRSAMVAARPRSDYYPQRLLAYETLSETNWAAPYLDPAFQPNFYMDITDTLDRKIAAFRCFESQCHSFPDERSPEALRALAQLRGATVRRHAAEAFVLLREVG
jgi:LmbE family N-acetylglucosaminyl deacetylase